MGPSEGEDSFPKSDPRMKRLKEIFNEKAFLRKKPGEPPFKLASGGS